MNEPHDYLVISRGQWDATADRAEIQAAIDRFYGWLDAHIAAGRMKMGSRLGTEGVVVGKTGVVHDGPFGEGKEVIGGTWHIVARSLAEAAALAAENPCLQFGLTTEVRPLESERGSAYRTTNETPR